MAGPFLGLVKGPVHINKGEIPKWCREFVNSQQVAAERANALYSGRGLSKSFTCFQLKLCPY